MTVITTVSAVVAVPKRSWSDIVKGRSVAKVEPLRPAERGSYRCACTGQFLVMLGHYGWIMALEDIDHPDADRHGGRIYLRAADLRSGARPKEGDEVTFFLYSDASGLGAEDCYVTGEPHPEPVKIKQVLARSTENKPRCQLPQPKPKSLSADAHEFVPTVLLSLDANVDDALLPEMNAGAAEFVPPPPGLGITTRAVAPEVIPDAPLAYCTDMCVMNMKRFFDDDELSDDDTESTASGASGRVMVAPGLATCFMSKEEGKPDQWATLASRCAQAVDAVGDASSWCDEESDDGDDSSLSPALPSGAEEWASVSARCAEAVARLEHPHSWHMRNVAAAAKVRADVGDDIRWDVVLDALAELDESPVGEELATIVAITSKAPPGFAPPGFAPPGFAPPGLAPPGLAPPGLAPPGLA